MASFRDISTFNSVSRLTYHFSHLATGRLTKKWAPFALILTTWIPDIYQLVNSFYRIDKAVKDFDKDIYCYTTFDIPNVIRDVRHIANLPWRLYCILTTLNAIRIRLNILQKGPNFHCFSRLVKWSHRASLVAAIGKLFFKINLENLANVVYQSVRHLKPSSNFGNGIGIAFSVLSLFAK